MSDALTRAVQPGRYRGLAHPERAGSFAIREAQQVDRDERVRKRTVETRDELTPQEAQIARLASDGLSNPDIGARLFISQHTVAYHLRKVFSKLGITARNQLERVLPAGGVRQTA